MVSDVVNTHQAKTNLSRLIERVMAGEEVVIARAGRPVAKLVPYRTDAEPRHLGCLKGEFAIPDDFDAPLPEGLLRSFEGRRR